MHKLSVGDKVTFDIVNIPDNELGDVNVSNNGVEVKDLFRVLLDAGETSKIELRGYVRDSDGRLVNIYDLDDDGAPELVGVKNTSRKFIISGKMELTLEKEVLDETS